MSTPHCETCRFFLKYDVSDSPNPYEIQHENLEWGECVRFPPMALEYAPRSMPPTVAAFPSTHTKRWCGEYQERSAAPQMIDMGTLLPRETL